MTKKCSQCNEEKPVSEFYPCKGGRLGVRGECKVCNRARNSKWKLANRDKCAANAKRWRDGNPNRARDIRRKTVFGMEYGTYDKMLELQGGVCAICRNPCKTGRDLAVDHCHKSGRVRGLLCAGCNGGLGLFEDNIEDMERAIEYIRRHKELKENQLSLW